MKKRIGLIILGMLVAMILVSRASPALASTKQTSAVLIPSTAQRENEQGGDQLGPDRGRSDVPLHEVNQFSSARDFSTTNATYEGRNEGNYGNQGSNKGYMQDNAENSGNQVIHSREVNGQQRINQFSCGLNGSTTNTLYAGGENQGNDGNQGFNQGYIQDNTGNRGNQIIN